MTFPHPVFLARHCPMVCAMRLLWLSHCLHFAKPCSTKVWLHFPQHSEQFCPTSGPVLWPQACRVLLVVLALPLNCAVIGSGVVCHLIVLSIPFYPQMTNQKVELPCLAQLCQCVRAVCLSALPHPHQTLVNCQHLLAGVSCCRFFCSA